MTEEEFLLREWNQIKVDLTENGFLYKGELRELNERTILLDSRLTDGETVAGSHRYRDIREAFSAPELSMGRPGTPVTIYIMPNVYWIDDPDAADVMQKREGYALPFGMYVNCRALHIVGLGEFPNDVVIAGNRGQSHACNGNYTMICFQVEELYLSDLTLGNYCSIDLEYDLNPYLWHRRRTGAVTQAQIAVQQGEKLYAKNCVFEGRLNLDPVCGAKRALYMGCQFESTDDALNGNAVYVECIFEFYGGRPIFQATRTGDVFIDCSFSSGVGKYGRWRPDWSPKRYQADVMGQKDNGGKGHQYLTKEGGSVALIDCSYFTLDGVELGWTKYPKASLKCYQYQVSQNDQPVTLGGEDAPETVQLQGKKALEAYFFEQDGQRFVNVGNLLGGSDDWDPMGVLAQAKSAGKTGIPTLLTITPDQAAVVSGEAAAALTAKAYLFSHEECRERVRFFVEEEDAPFVKIRQEDDCCVVEGCNHSAETRKAVIHACTESGLEAAAEITVEPYLLQAPGFAQEPFIRKSGKTLILEYGLSVTERADASEISWYRCDDGSEMAACGQSMLELSDRFSEETDGILCSASRPGSPLRIYHLTAADEGRRLKAVIRPKVRGSLAGEAISVVTAEPVGEADVDRNRLSTDFFELPERNQLAVQEGRWTFDCAKPEDIEVDSATFGSWKMNERVPAWKYGETGNGSIGAGLYQNTQGARLRYTPVNPHGKDMCMTVKADPAKTAGQGFGSAGQYLDLGIKFDTEKLTGYALRVIRIKEASDAVAMALVEYENGRSRYLTGLQMTTCFLTGCTIRVALEGKKLTATAATETPQPMGKQKKGYVQKVDLEAEVSENPHGGILVWHTGTPGTGGWQNTTMLHGIEVIYGD
ncbi:MAG: hypothetical protein NC305_06640 [Lachnospiraceae bacterium]|nr:hypothetical protein [Muribaculaceae bacterium]MCM1410210.1 hypothetical protein [Lachnospiraceae bacterium]